LRGIRGLVTGRVQGVGYRWFAVQAARRWGVKGQVRNLPDGRVEFLAQGSTKGVSAWIEALRRGPQAARVDDVVFEELSAEGPQFEGFEIR